MQCQLVVIGRLSPSQEAAIDENGIVLENHVNLSEAELVRQYQECDLVSFASTFEGFGMPIVEAQRVGRPVVTSRCSSMPEVAGAAACFVDPLDVASIRAGIRSVIENREYRESLIVAGYENAKRFDANTIALQYLSMYRRVFAGV
jgi:glycosyltransferase involved in cell wall biosynthesis